MMAHKNVRIECAKHLSRWIDRLDRVATWATFKAGPSSLALIALLSSHFVSYSARASECQQTIGTCAYYACMNERMQCQPEQYFTRFAERYCNIFEAKQDHFSEVGRETLTRIKICLQGKVESETDLTCGNALSKAYGHHRDCYLASGFCALPTHDKFAILSIVYPELRHHGFQVALLQTVAGCIRRGELLDQSEGRSLRSSILLREPISSEYR